MQQRGLDSVGLRSCRRIYSLDTCWRPTHTSHWPARWNIHQAFAHGGSWWRWRQSNSSPGCQTGRFVWHHLDADVCRSSARSSQSWQDVALFLSTRSVQSMRTQHREAPTCDARCIRSHQLQVCLHFCPMFQGNSSATNGKKKNNHNNRETKHPSMESRSLRFSSIFPAGGPERWPPGCWPSTWQWQWHWSQLLGPVAVKPGA